MARISEGARKLGLQVVAAEPGGEWVVDDVWTTVSYRGQSPWDVSPHPYSLPQWARDKYLKPPWHEDYNDDGGADHHIFGAAFANGRPVREIPVLYSSDNWATVTSILTKEGNGWANLPMFGGSAFYPENGERGPWAWMPAGAAEMVTGGGMPGGHHVSMWATWKRGEVTTPPDPGEPGDCEDGVDVALIRVELGRIDRAVEQIREIIA